MKTQTAEALAWRVEDACQNAWPALRQARLDGWVARFGDGLSRRANSANPLRAEPRADDDLIAACEALYRRHGRPAIFRLPSIIAPAADRRLAALGYAPEGESCVLYGDIGGVEAERDPAVRLSPRPGRRWLAAMAALQRQPPEQSRVYRRIVGSLLVPAAFAALAEDGAISALAYGAIHDGLLAVESVVTDPRRRRRGCARRVVASLAAWAAGEGAVGACLEVEAGNRPALALYDRIGLKTELYRYHYRREPPPPR